MKRNITALLLTLVLLLAFTASASADMLWEPYGNEFYNYEDCETVARFYFVPEGQTVNLYETPRSTEPLAVLQPGTRVYVGFRQEVDGEIWGVGYASQDSYQEGWFRLGRLQQEYDHQAFYAEHQDQLTEYEDQLLGYEIKETIRTWTYPGSGISDGQIPQLYADYNDGVLDCRYVYTDPNGGQWGYVGYYMGHCGWIYLDDPENPAPPSFPQFAKNTVTDTGDETAPQTAMDPELIWILALVAAVVLLTAGGIFLLKHKKQR